MKKIHENVYHRLNARQRLAAAISAQARGDASEIDRLIKSQPDHNATLAARMNFLNGLAVAYEADVREAMIGFFAVFTRNDELATYFLQSISNQREAWRLTMEKMGIDPVVAEHAGPPKSALWNIVEPLLPDPDNEHVRSLANQVLAEVI